MSQSLFQYFQELSAVEQEEIKIYLEFIKSPVQFVKDGLRELSVDERHEFELMIYDQPPVDPVLSSSCDDSFVLPKEVDHEPEIVHQTPTYTERPLHRTRAERRDAATPVVPASSTLEEQSSFSRFFRLPLSRSDSRKTIFMPSQPIVEETGSATKHDNVPSIVIKKK